jgi:hypothetical protein
MSFIGKFMNNFDVTPDEPQRCPSGFDVFDPLIDATVFQYTDFDFVSNVSPCVPALCAPGVCVCVCETHNHTVTVTGTQCFFSGAISLLAIFVIKRAH